MTTNKGDGTVTGTHTFKFKAFCKYWLNDIQQKFPRGYEMWAGSFKDSIVISCPLL